MRYLLLSLLISLFISFPLVCFSAADEYYVTTTGAGDKSGTEWAKAFSIAEFDADIEDNAEVGDVYYVEAGTYTLTENLNSTAKNGSSSGLIKVIGVASGTTAEPPTGSDFVYGDDRPLFACGGYTFSFGDYYMIKNLRITTTNTSGLSISQLSEVFNCKSTNTSGSSSAQAMKEDYLYGAFTFCEASCTGGDGIYPIGDAHIVYCYIHDCGDDGTYWNYNSTFIAHCVYANITDRALSIDALNGVVVNNTFYNCGTAIRVNTTGDGLLLCVVNNLFSDNTTVFLGTAAIYTGLIEHNAFYNNGTISDGNLNNGDISITETFPMVNPAGENYQLTPSNQSFRGGLMMDSDTMDIAPVRCSIGADQGGNDATTIY